MVVNGKDGDDGMARMEWIVKENDGDDGIDSKQERLAISYCWPWALPWRIKQ